VSPAVVGHDIGQALQRRLSDMPGRRIGRFYQRRHSGVAEAGINPDNLGAVRPQLFGTSPELVDARLQPPRNLTFENDKSAFRSGDAVSFWLAPHLKRS
jgi:hypothetical protein